MEISIQGVIRGCSWVVEGRSKIRQRPIVRPVVVRPGAVVLPPQ